jgi:hypothetical protein
MKKPNSRNILVPIDFSELSRFVLEDKQTALRGVTLKTGFVLAEQCHAAAFERLRKASSRQGAPGRSMSCSKR